MRTHQEGSPNQDRKGARYPTTRDRILAYLQENRTASVVTLSRAWGLTRAALRYQFNELIEEGLVELVPRDANQPASRGRPVLQYRLAAGAAPHNLAGLGGALLAALAQSLPAEQMEESLRCVAAHLAGAHRPPAALPQRFNQAIAFLNRRAYHARWEAAARGPRILLRSCPYAPLLPGHPQICRLDRYLLERLVQLPLAQTSRINPDTGIPPMCVFEVRGQES